MSTFNDFYNRILPLREVGDKYIEYMVYVQLYRRLAPPFPQEDWWNEFN